MKRIRVIYIFLFVLCRLSAAGSVPLIVTTDRPGSETLALVGDQVADIVIDESDAEVAVIAANLLAEDIERVTGRKPQVRSAFPSAGNAAVLVGTIGHSRFIDALVDSGKLDVSAIRGKWESFVIATIDGPGNGVDEILVIAGSDRRGTAYGVFTLSESIGVSPWYWWADVPSVRKDQLHVSRKALVQGPPSVKYRGIFINDEDWGLQPWAAKHMDPDIRDIGPNTYARVFELLLRLKANYIWPAMHPCTQAFNIYPENKVVADRYAIVMGASHCEPMLRNNVTEWDKDARGAWNYESNPDGVYDYWEERVAQNGQFENVYTVGMRGIHDSGVPGGRTKEDKLDILERVIKDQRKIISEFVSDDPSSVPQIFCPYKEVLDIYKLGMDLPDDITIVWPDDNHGYIRNLSTPGERRRAGGSGIYYHMSYWGAPEDYLWLASTSPAKIAYEMGKAYAYGANRLWVFNVGDIKPCELEMEFALRLAYDIESWPVDRAMDCLESWAAETFGDEHAAAIAKIFREYYRLTQQARPEHMNRVLFSDAENEQRLADFKTISDAASAIYSRVDAGYRDAFFELVLYPVKGADLMNRKWTYAAMGDADQALASYDEIQELTEHYNRKVAGGKWEGIMDSAPRKRPVFGRPEVNRGGDHKGDASPVLELRVDDAQCKGDMKLADNGIVASGSAVHEDDTDSTATIKFTSKTSQKADLYFLARCPDTDHDSWFVSFNSKKTTSNDHPTGTDYRWIRIMEVELKKGRNELVVSHREPGPVIRRVVLMEPGTVPPSTAEVPDFIFAAHEYSDLDDGAAGQWKPIEGLGIESHAMAVFPYERPSIRERDFTRAPSISYTFERDADQCSIECRFLPTHRINEGMGLRYAVSVDGGPIQVQDINTASKSRTWADNVLNGFSMGRTRHELRRGSRHTVRLYLLDPGMVLSQVRIFSDEAGR